MATHSNLDVNYNTTTKAITVTGGDNGGSNVTLDPGKGNTVAWNRKNSGGPWKFAMLSIKPNGQFIMDNFADAKIKITDNNENNSSDDDVYEYTLCVYDKKDQLVHCLDPQLINKGAGGG